MARIKAPKKAEDKTPVFTWGFKSSKTPLAGGVMFDYVAQLNQDGTVSCNCPGWRFVKKGQSRRCKHTDTVQGDVPEILKSWRNGETFEVKEFNLQPSVPASAASTTSPGKVKVKQSDTKIKFNRVVEY
jgi:hypothetical protein